MRRRNALPPLPGKYRTTEPVSEQYGLRGGAFVLSLVCLLTGLVLLSVEPPTKDYARSGAGAALIEVFFLSAWGSHFWSDQPVIGLRRIASDLQFAVASIAGAVAIGAAFYGLAVVLSQVVQESPLLMLAFVLVLGVLVLVMHRTSVVDLRGVDLKRRFLIKYAESLFSRDDILKR